MTEDEIRAALHRMVDEDGDEHQTFLAGLGEPQRQAVAEALAVLEVVRNDVDVATDTFYVRLGDAFERIKQQCVTFVTELRQSQLRHLPGQGRDYLDVAMVERMREDVQATQAALNERDEVLRAIAMLNPIIKDETGQDVCFFRCGYGTLVGVTDDTKRYTHRPGCLCVRAGQRLHWRHWQGTSPEELAEMEQRLQQQP